MHKSKINWEGSFFMNSSLALVNREICKRLIREQIYDLGIIPYEKGISFTVNESMESMKKYFIMQNRLANITIRHQWPTNFEKSNSDRLIIFQPWEFGAIPREWYIPMKYFVDEVWVPSTSNKESYTRSGIPEHKIRVIPLGIDPEVFHYNVEPLELETKKNFRYLFVGGTIYRKGIDVLLQSYIEEFSSGDDVCLVIKDFGVNSFYTGMTAEQKIKQIQENPNHPEILYLDENLSSKKLASLYKSCNCLVQPYRGEGFGLPIVESMACGTPVIVPSLGPVRDFCDEDTTFFISSQEELISMTKINGIELLTYPWWIKIETNELRKQLRNVYENKELIKRKGEKASKKILSQFTWDNTVRVVSNALREVIDREKLIHINEEEIIQLELDKAKKLFENYDYYDSLAILKSLVESYPYNIFVRYYTAIAYFQTQKEYYNALEHFIYISNQMEGYPKHFQAEIWNYIGACYANVRKYDKAVRNFKKGVNCSAGNIDIVIESYKQMINNFDEGKNLITRHDLYNDLGNLYLQEKDVQR